MTLPPIRAPLPARQSALQRQLVCRVRRVQHRSCARRFWEAMHEELRQPPVARRRRVGELSEHLAQVCSTIAALAAEEPSPLTEEPSPLDEELTPRAEKPSPLAEEPSSLAEGPSPLDEELTPRAEKPSPLAEEPSSLAEGPSPLAEELTPLVPVRASEIAIHDIRGEGPQESATPRGGDSLAWIEPGGESPYVGALHPGAHLPRAGGEGPVAWAEAIEASLGCYAVDGLPFAVLLVEVLGVERLAQAEPPAILASLLEDVERAIRPELRRSDTVVCERRGRCWLTVSRIDAVGARTLAERLARSVRTVVGHRGTPLDLAIGVAVCPVDGRDVATLTAHADVGLYAARAAGRAVAPVDDAP